MTFFARSLKALTVAALAASATAAGGCGTYRVEYHKRPAYYHDAAEGQLADRVVLEDGTVLVYKTKSGAIPQHQAEQREKFKIREELEDGTIKLRALVPEHVIANALTCLENDEYELMYRELLSEHTRLEWEGLGNDVDDFAAYFSQHRGHMMRTLTRLYLGLSQLETVVEKYDNGVIECRLSRRVAESHKFTRIRMIREGYGLKLLTIR